MTAGRFRLLALLGVALIAVAVVLYLMFAGDPILGFVVPIPTAVLGAAILLFAILRRANYVARQQARRGGGEIL